MPETIKFRIIKASKDNGIGIETADQFQEITYDGSKVKVQL